MVIFRIKGVDNGICITIKHDTKLRQPTRFWFINSNGKIINDYEERAKVNNSGLAHKKITGNYFKSMDDARIHLSKVYSDAVVSSTNHLTK